MTPPDSQQAAEILQHMQEDQVRAAWVQAWAGIAQAVGAMLAIGTSVWLAFDAAARERKADRRAEERAIAADLAAEARAKAAAEANIRRASQALRVEHDAPLALVVELADRIIAWLRESEASYQANSTLTHYVVNNGGPETVALLRAADVARELQRDADAIILFDKFKGLFDRGRHFMGPPSVVAKFYGDSAVELQALRDQVAARIIGDFDGTAV